MTDIETFYLIDYENVHGDGLTGCQDLGKKDHIVIFFTPNAKKIDMSEISDHGSADLEMIEVPAGKQSADMHIGSYLGYLAGKNEKNCSIVIVSKDSDFDKVISFWVKKTGIAADRTEQIKKRETKKRQQAKQHQVVPGKTCAEENGTKKKLNQEVIQRLRSKRYESSVANTVAEIVMRCYGNERMLLQVHNALKDTYSNYLEVYETIKPVLVKYADAGKRHL